MSSRSSAEDRFFPRLSMAGTFPAGTGRQEGAVASASGCSAGPAAGRLPPGNRRPPASASAHLRAPPGPRRRPRPRSRSARARPSRRRRRWRAAPRPPWPPCPPGRAASSRWAPSLRSAPLRTWRAARGEGPGPGPAAHARGRGGTSPDAARTAQRGGGSVGRPGVAPSASDNPLPRPPRAARPAPPGPLRTDPSPPPRRPRGRTPSPQRRR